VTAPIYDAQEARQESSSAKIMISREDLEKLDAATTGEILRQLPGVSLTTESSGRRGRDRTVDRLEPRIMVDGEALPGGNRMAMRLPVELIERIEIIKNSTAEFPSGAGGTINLIMRDVPTTQTGTFRLGIINIEDAWGARVGGVYDAHEGENDVLWMGFANSRPLRGERTTTTQRFTAGVRNDWDIETDREHGRENYLHLAPRFTRDLGAGARLTISPFLMFNDHDRVTNTQRLTYTNPLAGTGLTGDGRERTTTLQLGVKHFLPQKRGSTGLNLFDRQIGDRVMRTSKLKAGRYVERPVNVGQAHETSLVADFKTKLAALPALTLRGNASTSRLTHTALSSRQESPRLSGNPGFDYEHAPWKLAVGGNLSLNSRITHDINNSVQQTQRARQQLDLYATHKLDRKLSLRLTMDNVTRAEQGHDTRDLSGSTLTGLEEDRLRGGFLSIEDNL